MGSPTSESTRVVFPCDKLDIHRYLTCTWKSCLCSHSVLAFAQNIILFLLGLPTHIAVFQQPATLSTSDYILTSLAIIDLLVEFTADNQQFSFQTYKQTGKINHNEWIGARIQWTPADAKRGFVTRGLWAWSRHPNFLCEQSFWVRHSHLTLDPGSHESLFGYLPFHSLLLLFYLPRADDRDSIDHHHPVPIISTGEPKSSSVQLR